MLFQSTHEERQGAEAPAEPGKRTAKSPLQRILTAHIMSRWAQHEGALAHISLKWSVEMLELQCAQRFPARPADPDSSIFVVLFPAPQSEPSQPNVPTERTQQMHLNCNPLGFLLDLSAHKSETRFPLDVWVAFSCRSFKVPIPKAQSRTLCSCKMGIDPVIMSSLASSTQVLFAVTIISWMSWHACRVTPRPVLCVSITRC